MLNLIHSTTTIIAPWKPHLFQTARVRCHKFFFDNENDAQACKIKHNEDPVDGERDEYNEDDPLMTLACCGLSFTESNGEPDGFCIVAAHTTDPDIVRYCDDDIDEDVNTNVIRCSETCKLPARLGALLGNGTRLTPVPCRLTCQMWPLSTYSRWRFQNWSYSCRTVGNRDASDHVVACKFGQVRSGPTKLGNTLHLQTPDGHWHP
jgi:hypothetical protein